MLDRNTKTPAPPGGTSGGRPRLLGDIDAGQLMGVIGEAERQAKPDSEPQIDEALKPEADGVSSAGAFEPSKSAEKIDVDTPVLTLDFLEKLDLRSRIGPGALALSQQACEQKSQ